MYADINRDNLDPKKLHFSRFLLHQGALLLASDINEQSAIFQYYLRQFIIDFVGPRWRTKNSFEIGDIETKNKNFNISAGHFYVYGILCVNEENCWYSPKDNAIVQPMFPTPEWGEIQEEDLDGSKFAVYLECWERHVNSIQCPELIEAALGGIDTSSRLEIAWQVRILTEDLAKKYFNQAVKEKTADEVDDDYLSNLFSNIEIDGGDCDAHQKILDLLDVASPKLRVWTKGSKDKSTACSITSESQYQGLENQLYRVEIHNPGTIGEKSIPSFKWSRENGSVVFKILNVARGSEASDLIVDIETWPRDRRYGLCIGDWVELCCDEVEFGQIVLPLAKVSKMDPTLGRLTLTVLSPLGDEIDEFFISKNTVGHHPFLRRWDQNNNYVNKEGTINITESASNDPNAEGWIELEREIIVQFGKNGNYRKGDYWLVPARVATGKVEWEMDDKGYPVSRPTDGIKRHRAVLAIISNEFSSCACTVIPQCENKAQEPDS
jgi:hypothetical protein